MTLLAVFDTPRDLHAFMKSCAGLLFFSVLYARVCHPCETKIFFVCLDTYRNGAVCLTFVLRLHYFLLELYRVKIASVGRQKYKQ